MTLGQGHDIFMTRSESLCEIYGLDNLFSQMNNDSDIITYDDDTIFFFMFPFFLLYDIKSSSRYLSAIRNICVKFKYDQ